MSVVYVLPSFAAPYDIRKNPSLTFAPSSVDGGDKGQCAAFVNVNDFGAVGDGVTNDLSAIQAAFEKARVCGGVLQFETGKVYFINTDKLARSTNVLDFTGISRLTIDGGGGTILTGKSKNRTTLFNLANVRNVSIQNIRLKSGYESLDSKTGQDWAVISEGSTGIRFYNVEMIYGHYGIAVVGFGQAKRVEQISASNIKFTGVYYPQNFAGNGDGYFARDIITRNCGRSYFPWNVKNHDVWVDSQQGGPFSDVLLKVYADPTKYSKLENIKLVYQSDGRYMGSGSQRPGEAAVAIDIQQASAMSALAEIANVSLRVRVKFLSRDINSNLFIIRKYTASGSGDLRTRGYKVRNVSLSGEVADTENLAENEPQFYSSVNGSSWDGEDVEEVSVKDLIFVRSGMDNKQGGDRNSIRNQ